MRPWNNVNVARFFAAFWDRESSHQQPFPAAATRVGGAWAKAGGVIHARINGPDFHMAPG